MYIFYRNSVEEAIEGKAIAAGSAEQIAACESIEKWKKCLTLKLELALWLYRHCGRPICG